MKTVSLLVALALGVCLVGCEDPELVTCQQEKGVLQGQLDQANSAITEKDSQIQALKTENTDVQTKAMESIQTMMQKQAAKDNEIKQKLAEKTQQVKDLEAKVQEVQAALEKSQKELKAAQEMLKDAQAQAAAAAEAAKSAEAAPTPAQ